MKPSTRTVLIAPQAKGWAVISRYSGGKWDGFESVYYCRWYWQALREYKRASSTIVATS